MGYLNYDEIKQGDTLPVSGRLVIEEDGVDISDTIDFSLWSIECNVTRFKDPSGTPYRYDLDIQLTNPGGVFADEVPSSETLGWVVNSIYQLDIRVRDENGQVRSSPTYQVKCVAAVSGVPA